MASWREILAEVGPPPKAEFDEVRRKYLGALSSLTGRNTIAYYSGWLAHPNQYNPDFSIVDNDMNGFMACVNGMDRSMGLDLLLHTPGGEINATEAIVNYLRYAFNGNIRAIVPQQAMSAGTMISLACSEVVMAKHSSLGPIDPQVNGAPAHGIIEEFDRIRKEFKDNPHSAQAFIPILQKYTPTLIGACEKAIKLAEQIVGDWLVGGMLKDSSNPEEVKKQILDDFGSHKKSLNHSRHFNFDKVKTSGVKVVPLEENHGLQDAVLSVHHALMITLTGTAAIKIIENQNGHAFLRLRPIPSKA